MAAAAEAFGDCRYLGAVFAAQAYAIAAAGEFAQEHGDLDIADGKRVVDQYWPQAEWIRGTRSPKTEASGAASIVVVLGQH